jgi:hypothetical protein
MSYNIESLKKKIAILQGQKPEQKEKKDLPKFVWFKPQVNKSYDVRFLTLTDKDGNPLEQPFFEVSYYDNTELAKRRFVAPSQFGKPDPIKDMVLELAKDRSKEAWFMRKKLTPKERYYAAMIVRGGTSDVSGEIKPVSEDTVVIWELTPKLCKDVYAILVHTDYVDEDLFSLENGYDFTITVNPTDKLFNGHPVKEIKMQPRRKSSPLTKNKKDVEKITSQVPNFYNYFDSQVLDEEKMQETLQAFLSGKADGDTDDTSERGEIDMASALSDIDKQFAGL